MSWLFVCLFTCNNCRWVNELLCLERRLSYLLKLSLLLILCELTACIHWAISEICKWICTCQHNRWIHVVIHRLEALCILQHELIPNTHLGDDLPLYNGNEFVFLNRSIIVHVECGECFENFIFRDVCFACEEKLLKFGEDNCVFVVGEEGEECN